MKDLKRQMALRDFEQDTKDFMATPGNRRIYVWLMNLAQMDRVSWVQGCSHADMAFRDGMKNLAGALRDRVMTACPGMHLTALQESRIEKPKEDLYDE